MGSQLGSQKSKPSNLHASSVDLEGTNLRVRGLGLREKLIIPFGVLTIVTAVIGIFVLTRFISTTIEERFHNQLIEASRVGADSFILLERDHLDDLRLMAFTIGIDQAILDSDIDEIEELLFPLVLNDEIDVLSVVGLNGVEIISFIENQETGDYDREWGSNLSEFEFIELSISRFQDDLGDKYADIVETQRGLYIFTTAPVVTAENELVGILVLGTDLNQFIRDLKSQALADIVLLDSEGKFWVTTLLEPEDGFEILEMNFPSLIDSETFSYSETQTLYDRDFQGYYSVLEIREEPAGYLGVFLSRGFILSTQATNRNLLIIIFSLGFFAIITTGVVISRHISKPILRLRDVSLVVSGGNLEQRTEIDRSDEIGQLANTFDYMTDQLHDRTIQVTQLYSEAEERSEKLVEINQKLQEAQQYLVQSEKLGAIAQLSAGIVHDVRNPLANIKGLAEEVYEEVMDDKELSYALKMIMDNAGRANTIVSDLLKFARHSESKPKYQNLNESLSTAVRLTEFSVRKNKIDVDMQLSEEPILTVFDEQLFEQVIINLIQNAIQAMKAKGVLTISSEMNGKTAVVRVSDTGKGIPKKNLTKIFDPFFTTKKAGEGTGLGLSVSYGIVTQHRGTIEVKSKVKKGTTFTIKLPIVGPDEEIE